MRAGRQAEDDVAAMNSERAELMAFNRSPIVKPLAARGQSRLRVGQLEDAISARLQDIEELTLQLEAAKRVLDFAAQLDAECRIQLAIEPEAPQ